VVRGQVLAKPGYMKVHNKFLADMYVLKTAEGGRSKPFASHYQPQAFMRTANITCTITLPDGTEMAMPGDNVKATVELMHPLAVQEGQRFALREGGKTVASGLVTKLL